MLCCKIHQGQVLHENTPGSGLALTYVALQDLTPSGEGPLARPDPIRRSGVILFNIAPEIRRHCLEFRIGDLGLAEHGHGALAVAHHLIEEFEGEAGTLLQQRRHHALVPVGEDGGAGQHFRSVQSGTGAVAGGAYMLEYCLAMLNDISVGVCRSCERNK